jgi:hypothetical protein
VPGPAFSDAEFIELWRIHKSPLKIAEITGIGIRAIKGRRRRVEQRLNINLESSSEKAKVYEHLGQVEYKANHQLGIENGTIIVGSDAHFWPGVRTTAFNAFLKFIGDLQPKAVIMNGDVLDGSSISRHPRIGWEKVPSLIEELKACQASLEEVESAAGRAKLIWPLGNHCARFSSRLANIAPEYGQVHGFQLKDHFPAWTPCWATWVTDNVVVKHRMRSGVHATHNNTVNSGVSIVTGHLHSLKVTPFSDYNGTRYGVDTGTLAEPQGPQFVNYTEAGPLNWRSGFAVLTIHKGKLLWPELVYVSGPNTVEFRGQVIEV